MRICSVDSVRAVARYFKNPAFRRVSNYMSLIGEVDVKELSGAKTCFQVRKWSIRRTESRDEAKLSQ